MCQNFSLTYLLTYRHISRFCSHSFVLAHGWHVGFVVHFVKQSGGNNEETDIAGILTSTHTIALVGATTNPIVPAIA